MEKYCVLARPHAAAALAFSRLANSYLCPYALPRGLADVVAKLGKLKLRRRQHVVPLGARSL